VAVSSWLEKQRRAQSILSISLVFKPQFALLFKSMLEVILDFLLAFGLATPISAQLLILDFHSVYSHSLS
jgi:hypothetical protein